MGVVFQARDTDLDRIVALKMIRSGYFARPNQVEAFQKEARAVARLRHENIVTVFEFGQVQGRHFLAMEYVAGGSLHNMVADLAAGPPRPVVELMVRVARAVHHAHEEHILHRDLKPGNIFIDANGAPRVGDFGLVKFLDVGEHDAGRVVGTFAYMSPEQAAGLDQKVGPTTDVWALGVTLYELLTGKRPFTGCNVVEMTKLIREAAPQMPRVLRRALDLDLEAIVLKCMAKDPVARYASASDLADDLDSWLSARAVSARRQPFFERQWRRVRRQPWMAGFAAMLLLAAAGFLAARALDDPDRWIHDIQARLKRGEKVTLVGETGGPKGFRVRTAVDPSKVIQSDQKEFVLLSLDYCVLELLPDPGIDHYLFSAEIKHLEAKKDGFTGLVVCHSEVKAREQIIHTFSRAEFNDCFNDIEEWQEFAKKFGAKPPGGNRVSFKGGVLTSEGRELWRTLAPLGAIEYSSPNLADKQWRKLAFKVTPETVAAYWQGEEFASVSLAKANTLAEEGRFRMKEEPLTSSLPDFRCEFTPRQGLGVVVLNGMAAFRNVTIEPVAH